MIDLYHWCVQRCIPITTQPLEIAFANWKPSQEALNEEEKKKADLKKAKAKTLAAEEETKARRISPQKAERGRE